MAKTNIEIGLIDEITKNELLKIGQEIGEISLDAFLKDGVFRDLPVINFLTTGYHITENIRDRIFFKKVLLFLHSLQDIPLEERKRFVQRLEKKKGFKRKVGEAIIMALDRLDDMDKARISGNFFKAYIAERINFEELKRLLLILSNLAISDIEHLKLYANRQTILSIDLSGLFLANGLLRFTITLPDTGGLSRNPQPSVIFHTMPITKTLIELIFEESENNG